MLYRRVEQWQLAGLIIPRSGVRIPPRQPTKFASTSARLTWARVAQSVERGTHKPEVVGSIPTPGMVWRADVFCVY